MTTTKRFLTLSWAVVCLSVIRPAMCWSTCTWDILYTSTNLEGHEVSAECNPGGSTSCGGCSNEDVEIGFEDSYGWVKANKNNEYIWVNAIGGYTFRPAFPNNKAISLVYTDISMRSNYRQCLQRILTSRKIRKVSIR